MEIMEILKIIFAIILSVGFFAAAGFGFGFFWLIIWIICSKILRQVIGISFWILMMSMLILSGQVNAPLYIPLLDKTIRHVPYWMHVVTVASCFGFILIIILIPVLIALRVKYGKLTTVFNIKV